ncbi:MAG: PaaI family thioesterase [Acidobacteriaceae bacterium]
MKTLNEKKNKSQKRKFAASDGHALNMPMPGINHHCFGCAPGNRQGLRLRFQENADDGSVECEFRLMRRFEGPPGHLHGGIVATVLDEAMGKVNRQKGIVALTRRMTVEYLRPVPLGAKLRAVGWPVKVEGRKHFHAGEIRTLSGDVLARSEGLFIAIDPVEMFRKYGAGLPNATKTQRAGTAKLKG